MASSQPLETVADQIRSDQNERTNNNQKKKNPKKLKKKKDRVEIKNQCVNFNSTLT